MRDNPYKDLPPLERKPDGSLYRMTPAQRKQAVSLIRRECCCCEDDNCIVLDDGDTCTCPQTISFSVFGDVFVPKSNRAKYCPGCAARVHRRQKAVNTLRELQYAGLVEIQKQGCGPPRIGKEWGKEQNGTTRNFAV